MRKIFTLALAICLVFSGVNAQSNDLLDNPLRFQNGDFVINSDESQKLELDELADWPLAFQKRYGVVKLQTYPSVNEQLAIQDFGIEFLDAYRNGYYQVAVSQGASLQALNQYVVLGHTPWKTAFKNIKEGQPLPARIKRGDKVLFNAHSFKNVNFSSFVSSIQSAGFFVIQERANYGYVEVELAETDLPNLIALSEVQFIDWAYDYGQPENYTGRSAHRLNYISGNNTNGLDYEGQGVAVMMQDDGAIGPHIDQHGRVFNKWPTSTGDHGDHVSGTITGAGNLNPLAEGMAKKADMYVYKAAPEYQGFDSIWTAYDQYDLVITSTSYSNGCNAGYTAFARLMDDQIQQLPRLNHVFSGGNSGTSNCGYGAGSFWGNITGGHKVGKNVITVANLDDEDNVNTSSSRGPAHDGRIKPDISATGTQVFSTIGGYAYDTYTGTSMSCPGVSGTLAALYSAYEDIHGSEPEGGLMKSIVLNTADDIGNVGPDFTHGFGRINAKKAYEAILNSQYMTGQVSNSGSTTLTVNVPNSASQAKFMVYWTDPEASINASTALINDLDMTVTDPSSNVLLPYVLDHTPNPTTLNNPATTGADHLNNVEQVVIDNPTAGSYSIQITGFDVPQGPQEFYLVYWFESAELKVTYPVGGESFVPFSTEKIRWDVYPDTGSIMIEFSSNGGSTWNTVANSANASNHYFDWTVPNLATGNVMLRFSYGNTEVVTDEFSIIRTPTGLELVYACPDSIGLNWNNTTGATSYDVYKLGQKYMDSIGVSNTSDFVDYLSSPLQDSLWYSVSSNGPNGAEGKRAVAINHTPGIFNCNLPIDAAAFNLSPSSGTQFSCHGDSATVSFMLINNGTSPISSIDASANNSGGYSISETFGLGASSLAPGDSTLLVFPDLMPMSTGGEVITLSIDLSNDANPYNDTISSLVFVEASTSVNQIIWSEDFETFMTCSPASLCGDVTCVLTNGWVNEENYTIDDADWRTNSGGTPSNFTGPNFDHTLGNFAGRYLYVEASECFNSEALLVSPCIELAENGAPELSFWWNMYGADMGSLSVDVYDGTTWHLDVHLLEGFVSVEWEQSVVSLAAFAGNTVNIRFRALTGPSFRSDIAIDDINITQPPVANFDVNPIYNTNDVQLTDLSALADTMLFDLGDGTVLDYVPGTHTYSAITTYTLTQKVWNEAGSDSLTKDLTTLSVNGINDGKVSMYPNPTKDQLVFSISGNILFDEYVIYNLKGSAVEIGSVSQGDVFSVDVRQLPTGSYFIELKGNELAKIPFIKVE